MEQTPIMNENPILSIDKIGCVLDSNEAGQTLLKEWGVKVGEKLPSSIGDIVQRVISKNSPEKSEVNVGTKVYLVVFTPFPEQELVSISGFDISEKKELKDKLQESESQEMMNLELAEIVDIQAVQSLINDFYKLTHIPIGLNDIKGNVLTCVGWQDICIKFHRVHPEACKHCVESDTKLTAGILPGEIKLYKCKNNMWDIATPIIVSSQYIGYVFSGQFFFDDEPIDYELFRSQARKYGFDEEEYIAALKKVPRLSRETVETGMSFFMTFANMLSKLSYSNIKLAQSLAKSDELVVTLLESEERERARSNEFAAVLDAVPAAVWITHDPKAFQITGNRLSYEWLHLPEGVNISKSASESERPETYRLFKDGVEIPLEEMPVRMSASGKELRDYEFDLVYPDGKMLHLLGNVKPLLDEHGNPQGAVSAFIDITERKRIEEALRESEERFRSAFDDSAVAMALVCPDAHLLKVNDAFCQLLGFEKLELEGHTFLDFTYPEDIEPSIKTHRAVINKEKPFFWLEKRYIHKDGRVIWCDVSSSPVLDSKDCPIYTIAHIQDITERKEAEKALKKAYDSLEEKVKERTAELEKAYVSLIESEKGLAEAQRMAHIGNWDWNLITGEVYWSDEMYRIFGLNPQEPLATYTEFLNYIHPDDRDYVDKTNKKRLKGEPIDIDHRIILANGEERTVHSHVEIIFDTENKPIRLKGIVQDITERRRVEEKLRESEEKYRNIVETANEGIGIIDNELKLSYVNKKLEEMIGYSSEEIIGKSMWDFVSEDSKPIVKSILERGLRDFENPELKYKRKDGSHFWAQVNAKSIFDNDGKFIGILTMISDITKRKEAEETLKMIDIARKQEIHHRIKNNLQVISSLLDLQTEKFKGRKNIEDTQVLEAFRESQDRVISMALIHEELHKGGEVDTLNFSHYIKELADNLLLTYKIGNNNLILYNDINEGIFFNMDTAVPLGIIVNELVSNSLKYAFSDRDKGEIRIKLQKENGCKNIYVLSISDNGIGIPKDIDIENLESLGLQLVTTLVEQLDGELELKRNNGTEFIIKFSVTGNNDKDLMPGYQ